jgi:hypothetical protein
VFAERRPEHLSDEQAALRRGLRAKWRQLGSDRELLVGECAYEQWHRLLFARFLAENGLLLHPQYHAPVTLEDCQELAAELGEPDGWSVAARFAAEILPGIFRLDDPCFRLRLTPEGRDTLEQVVASLPAEAFEARDSLGWVYQFWQRDKKDEINASERKIGGADLGPVTQTFTENYMVRFLLENSLGAWWASRHPDSPLIAGFEYLRFADDGQPAAGSFGGWPERVAEVAVIDPCCGSGHFLVEAFLMLSQMRAEEEGLGAVEAQNAVLRDNLFGLELDPRCVQIAMFALALQAWKSGDGWRKLPVPNIACSGIPVKGLVEEWKKLARGDQRIENALERLHVLFRDADTLGSLIDPRGIAEGRESGVAQRTLDEIDWDDLAPVLTAATANEVADPSTHVLGVAATAIARAASFLTNEYTLVATNVPYLVRGAQANPLRTHGDTAFQDGSGDLATMFVSRSLKLLAEGGVAATVSPQNWLMLKSYASFRRSLLRSRRILEIAWLGTGAFRAVTGAVVNVHLSILQNSPPSHEDSFMTLDVSEEPTPGDKDLALRTNPLGVIRQLNVLESVAANPDARITATELASGSLLSAEVLLRQGLATGDLARFVRMFWELKRFDENWVRFQGSVSETLVFGGRSRALLWENGKGALHEFNEAHKAVRKNTHLRGSDVWNRKGVLVSQISLSASLYTGDRFDDTTTVLLPSSSDLLPALWAFVSSPEYRFAVRRIDSSLKVPAATLAKVPFDVERWREVASLDGALPEPWSDDPTQWLFEGQPEVSMAPLQVAVARLLGYRWAEQPESDDLDVLTDADGVVCLPSVAGEPPATDRLQQVLAAAYGASWSLGKLKELLEQAGSRKKSLADWLRDEFFKQHCALFGNRPFIWQVWDGQREGFAALVNYHRLDRRTLEKLTYTYLGQDWVERQRAAAREGTAGAEARLAAALELQRRLEAILAGEAPYDIYVRWKELREQPVGWEPDLNDGVRLNIRPFVEAGVLRAPFNIHWKKDRGKNPDGSERRNDVHRSLAEKLAARGETDPA